MIIFNFFGKSLSCCDLPLLFLSPFTYILIYLNILSRNLKRKGKSVDIEPVVESDDGTVDARLEQVPREVLKFGENYYFNVLVFKGRYFIK